MRRYSRRHIVLGTLLLGSVLFLLNAMRGTSPRGMGGEEELPADAPAAAAAPQLRPAAPPGVAFDRYARLANTNVFSARRSQPPPKKPKKVDPPPPLPSGDDAKKPRDRRPDFSDWSYVGYIEVDGEQLGILQNDTTNTCKYLAVGDPFEGAKVEAIDRDALRLRFGTGSTALSRPRDFPVTPLDKSASGGPKGPRQR